MKKKFGRNILCLILAFSLLFSSNALATVGETLTWEDKLSPQLRLFMEVVEPTEKNSVYIWLQDIDQDSVDRTVEQQIGITRDNVEVISEDMSESLLHFHLTYTPIYAIINSRRS
jgi:hypothetical protein